MARPKKRFTLEEFFAIARARIDARFEAERRELEREFQADLAAIALVYRLCNNGQEPPEEDPATPE